MIFSLRSIAQRRSRINRESARFCEQCGTPFGQTYPSCGAELRSGARFCDGCGQRLEGTPQEVAKTGGKTQPAAPPLPASFASGRYRVERFLGEGAKKRAFLARDTRIDRDVVPQLQPHGYRRLR